MREMCAVLLFGSVSLAADLPKNISAEARNEFVAAVAPLYQKARDDLSSKAEDAKTQMKFEATKKEGKQNLAKATAELARIEGSPWHVPGTPIVIIGEKEKLKTGDIGIVSPLGEYVGTKTDEGVQVDGLINPTTEKLPVRFFIASPLTLPKATKGKKNPSLPLPGLWFVAGFVEMGGKSVPVLYAFKLTDEEVKQIKGKK